MPKEKVRYTDQVKIYMPGGMFDGAAFSPNQPNEESAVFITELSPSESLYSHNIEYTYEENEWIDCHDFCHQIFTAIGLVAIGVTAGYCVVNIIAEYQAFDQFDYGG